ncbi:hypothetical protein P4S68_20660 [Pseudoalteromonas sp. Hal099]
MLTAHQCKPSTTITQCKQTGRLRINIIGMLQIRLQQQVPVLTE